MQANLNASRQPTLRLIFTLLAASGYVCTAVAESVDSVNDNLIFDIGVLKERGIDPKIAEIFRHRSRFLPGESSVLLTVNGTTRGRVKVRFDEAGTLCADRSFQQQAGLILPPVFADDIACFDLRRAWPQAEVHTEPDQGKVSLVVPPQAVTQAVGEDGKWLHGGSAGMLNYDASYMNSSGGVNFAQIASEVGLNVSDWILRSRQTFSRFNGKDNIHHQATYAQRSFASIKKVLQVGQVNLANSLFGTGQVQGFQMFPESALNKQEGAGLVDGVADSQSVVEVRQSGVLVHSTIVPSGPFRLQGFSLLNTSSDLQVTLNGSDGQQRQFTVPASALLTQAPSVSPGFSFGAGRLEQQGGNTPLVGTFATGWQLTPYTGLYAGLFGSSPWRAGSLDLDTQLFDTTRLNLQSTVAQDAKNSAIGTSVSALLSHSLTERLSISANGRQQTSGYRELSDALQSARYDTDRQSRHQWGGSISWAAEMMGSVSLSWGRTTTFAGVHSDYLRAGWNRQVGRAWLGLSFEHNTSTLSGQKDDRLYASFSMPLGDRRDVSSFLNTTKRSARGGVRYSDRASQDVNWSIASEHESRNNHTSASGNVSAVTRVSQLGASISHNSDKYTSWSTQASGAAVLHADGLTLSPHRVSDTFGIARVGDESGVRLNTPSGTVWTDWRGYAVLPALNGYRSSGIQVDTPSLKKNVDIANAWQETELARGAIGRVDFEVIRTRRVLVDAQMADGSRLPRGASLFDGERLVTVVADDGTVFVPNASAKMKLEVQHAGKTLCTINLTLPQQAASSRLYENTTATCE
ncbi:fimbria/pilus outer membrane usher protein [Erwinia pyrifoliae]|uniref:fimbria/pilus outer membrane usher protein n=1 Tax=Erwinia pyrifoliae TaxID=79967 RepID=UPI00223AECA3|nr:fimbria/pilus outer membrane usher protein [Erwinia pyrifoliae]MCT2387095.1 fimbria/pilus outer membrane usher protein [Erwinia pyrifoliae]MCU8587306.1 fimbria/pilus outer membrane usher protein [Erwinia pyrifoliae]